MKKLVIELEDQQLKMLNQYLSYYGSKRAVISLMLEILVAELNRLPQPAAAKFLNKYAHIPPRCIHFTVEENT